MSDEMARFMIDKQRLSMSVVSVARKHEEALKILHRFPKNFLKIFQFQNCMFESPEDHDFSKHFHVNLKKLIQANFSAKQTKCQGY